MLKTRNRVKIMQIWVSAFTCGQWKWKFCLSKSKVCTFFSFCDVRLPTVFLFVGFWLAFLHGSGYTFTWCFGMVLKKILVWMQTENSEGDGRTLSMDEKRVCVCGCVCVDVCVWGGGVTGNRWRQSNRNEAKPPKQDTRENQLSTTKTSHSWYMHSEITGK